MYVVDNHRFWFYVMEIYNLYFTIIMDEISIFTFDNTILRFTRIQQRKERK